MNRDQQPVDYTKDLTQRLDLDFALQAAGLGVWELDLITSKVVWDDRCRMLFGLAKGNLLSYEQAIQYIHPQDLDRVNQAVAWAMNPLSGGNYDQTYRTIGADDQIVRWVRFFGRGYFSPTGELYRFAGLAQEVTQQVEAHKQLEQSQREVLSLFEEAPVGIATISADDLLTFQSANPFYGQLVGRTPQALTGKPLLEALPELAGQGFDDLLREVIRTGVAFTAKEVAVELRRNDRLETIYVDLTYQPRRAPDGTVSGILVVATDVTRQVESRRQVEASETKLRSIIAAAPAGIGLFVGRDLIIENPNQTFIDIVGKGPGIEGLPLREAMPELLTEGQPFLKILDDVFTTGIPFLSPASLVKITQNGVLNDNYYNISYTPVYDASGQVYAILDIAIDVTVQVAAQQALASSEAHLKFLQNTVPAMIFYLDTQQRYQSYNETFMRWFSVDATSALGKTVEEFIGPAAYQRVAPYLTLAYSGQPQRYEMRAPARLGEDRWLDIIYTPHVDLTGNVLGIIVMSTDITQSKQVETDLRQSEARYRALSNELEQRVAERTRELVVANQDLTRSNANLQQFAYIASHDLQEPLRKIQSFSDLLIRQLDEHLNETSRSYLERITAAGARMSLLIKDLLAYSRIATRQQTFGPVSLMTIVQDTLTTLEWEIQQTEARIQVDELPVVNGDESQLGQLFQNLLTNAIKFVRPDQSPVIAIRYRQCPPEDLPLTIKPDAQVPFYHQINVVDQGIGFDIKFLDRIFQVFQRLHGKNEFAGSGIGLAICQRVVENHAGGITAHSAPGQGATFSVYLPA